MKNISKIVLLLSLSLGISFCAHPTKNERPANAWLEPFESKWETQNSGKPYSLRRVTEPSIQNSESLRFEIRQGEMWHNSFRSEISTNEFVPMGSIKWYKFSFFLPQDFPIEDNRLVLAQWWAKTKKHLGEVNRSPILHLRFGDGTLAILIRRYPKRVTLNDEEYIQTRLFEAQKMTLGKWHSYVFKVKWTPQDDGFIQAWWNGDKIIDYKGITENQDDVGPVFKFGLYRDDSPKTYIAFFSDIGIGDEPISP